MLFTWQINTQVTDGQTEPEMHYARSHQIEGGIFSFRVRIDHERSGNHRTVVQISQNSGHEY